MKNVIQQGSSQKPNLLFLHTDEPISTIINNGFTGDWPLNRDIAVACDYVVLCRNVSGKYNHDKTTHNRGFMVGKVSNVIHKSTVNKGKRKVNRFIVSLSEFAEIDVDSLWPKLRNNVHYVRDYTLLGTLGELIWKPIAAAAFELNLVPSEIKTLAESASSDPDKLTMNQAKERLALTYGVRPEAIVITINF
jgi:hypothetical protein